MVAFPVVTGASGQDRIFDRYPDVALELVDSRVFDGRLQLLEYVSTVLDGPLVLATDREVRIAHHEPYDSALHDRQVVR